jgi:hypothetical protein
MQGSYKIVVVGEGGQLGNTCVITYEADTADERDAKEKDLEERMKKMERLAKRQQNKRKQI